MAGRPKGAKNKRTFRVEEIASRYEMDPFEVLMMIAIGDWKALGFDAKTKTIFTQNGSYDVENVPLSDRCNAAKEATKYLYPKKLELSTNEEGFKIVIEDYSR